MPFSESLRPKGPYDLRLSLRVAESLSADVGPSPETLVAAVRVDGKAAAMEVRQARRHPPLLEVSGTSPGLADLAAWMVFADADLRPFYRLAAGHPLLARAVERLRGLKGFRPQTLFEMAVTAVTEQQISLAAARRIRQRVVERFGDRVGDLWAFPTPRRLAAASPETLCACGLSRRKAEYIIDLSRGVAEGKLDLEGLRRLPDDEVREAVTGLRGFGLWSAEYLLVRGLGRMDCVPADDLGVRTVVGRALGGGSRISSKEVIAALEPFTPFRGLAAFYLLADQRLGVGSREG